MIGQDISLAKQFLINNELVAIPTETVYGLAGNAFHPDAVIKIYQVKKRPQFNPIIVHTNTIEKIFSFTESFPPILLKLAEKFWPGPLTILLPKKTTIHDLVTAGSNLVAVRIPNHELTNLLLTELEFPLAAPSANLFGSMSPTLAKHVDEQLAEQIPYILDGGQCEVGVESTIIKLNTFDKIEILRAGGISEEEIAEEVGYIPKIKKSALKPEAPGMLMSHYAPKLPFKAGDLKILLNQFKHKKLGVLSFSEEISHPSIILNKILSKSGNIKEAAKNFFTYLHELDDTGVEIILAEFVPDIDLGKAINDKLQRASAAFNYY